MNLTDIFQIDVGAVIASGVTAIATVFALRRRASRDTVELTKDRAEESVIAHLEKQRDQAVIDARDATIRANKAEAEKTEALSRVVRLTQEVEHLASQVKILKDLVERLGRNLDDTRADLNEYMKENFRLQAEIDFLKGQK